MNLHVRTLVRFGPQVTWPDKKYPENQHVNELPSLLGQVYGDDRIEQHGYRAEYQTELSALQAVAGNAHDSSDEHHGPAQSLVELSGMMNWRAIGWLALAVLMPASGCQASNQAVACHE